VVDQVIAGEFGCSSELAAALLTDESLVGGLTGREVQVLQGLADGMTQAQVARWLEISGETVRTHLKAARAKYWDLGREITNTASVLREARQDGWLSG